MTVHIFYTLLHLSGWKLLATPGARIAWEMFATASLHCTLSPEHHNLHQQHQQRMRLLTNSHTLSSSLVAHPQPPNALHPPISHSSTMTTNFSNTSLL
jgi:hypothetical protein